MSHCLTHQSFIDELTKHWPCREKLSNVEQTSSSDRKSNTLKNIDDQQKIIASNVSNIENPTKSNRGTSIAAKIPSEFLSTSNELSLKMSQQKARWDDNIDIQEGIITYPLPDGLPDGVLLQNKLQALMQTNTIHLNDFHFWTELENRLKNQRKVMASSILFEMFTI